MLKTTILAALAVSLSTTAFAGVDGTYVWKHGKATKELEVKQLDAKSISFSAVMGEGVIGGCGGSIDTSTAELNGKTAVFEGDGFKLIMKFKKNAVEVSEEGSGLIYHGASCEFSGKYNLKRSRK